MTPEPRLESGALREMTGDQVKRSSPASGGSVVVHMACAFQHLVWKRHPAGGLSGLGGSP